MKKFRLFIDYARRPALLILLAAAVLYFLLWFRLASIPTGLSEAEYAIQSNLANGEFTLKSIINNPLYMPYSLALFLLAKLGFTGILALRGLSVLIGVITAVSFFLILKRWYTTRVAILSGLLFVASSWYLHVARYGTPDIIYSSFIVIILAGLWLLHTNYRKLTLSLALLIATLYLYIPGLIWFIVPAAIWQSKRIASELKKVPLWFRVAWGVIGVALLAPLIWGIINNPSLLIPLLGMPSSTPSIMEYFRNLGMIPIELLAQGPENAAIWLGRLPYLDIFSGVMFLIGLYWSIAKIKLDRVKLQLGFLAFSMILVAFRGPMDIALLLPFIYFLIATGLAFMLNQWFSVFPRNPIARTVGTSLISLAVLVTMFYHINHYFIAWPNTPETRQAYPHAPVISDTIK